MKFKCQILNLLVWDPVFPGVVTLYETIKSSLVHLNFEL